MKRHILRALSTTAIASAAISGSVLTYSQTAQAAVEIPRDVVGEFQCVQTSGGWQMIAIHADFANVVSSMIEFHSLPNYPAAERCAIVSAAFNSQFINGTTPVAISAGDIRNRDLGISPILCAVTDPLLSCNAANQLVTLPEYALFNPDLQDAFVSIIADHFRYLDRSPLIHPGDPLTGVTNPAITPPQRLSL
ncbi:MAG: hypothetical protein ACFB0C_20825 [Leptolyngbyaceae cyanobacterium]